MKKRVHSKAPRRTFVVRRALLALLVGTIHITIQCSQDYNNEPRAIQQARGSAA